MFVARVAAWPTAFDVIDAEGVEFASDAEFIGDGEADACSLRAVAQGGVIESDGFIHGSGKEGE